MSTKNKHDFRDGNGPVPAHRHKNGGGWVAETATVADTAFVGPDAWVYGNARVFEHALVYGNARVSGNQKCKKDPVVITCACPWTITITDDGLANIGCQQKTVAEWMRMNRKQAKELNKDAVKFFEKIKQALRIFLAG